VAFTGGLKSKAERSSSSRENSWSGSLDAYDNTLKISFHQVEQHLVGTIVLSSLNNDDLIDDEKELAYDDVLSLQLPESDEEPILVEFLFSGAEDSSSLRVESPSTTTSNFSLSSAEEEGLSLIAGSLLDAFSVSDLSEL